MQPLAVDAALLRAVLTPELNLSVGRELMVRVANLQSPGHGTLSLAGMLLEAELPTGVKAGDELRLEVRELTSTRVVLAIREDSAPPVALAPAEPTRVPMPGGGSLQVTERDARRQARQEGTHSVSLRYDAPSLGSVEMTLSLSASGLRVALTVPRGGSHTLAEGAAPELSQALAAASGRPVQVTIIPRHEPLEVYA